MRIPRSRVSQGRFSLFPASLSLSLPFASTCPPSAPTHVLPALFLGAPSTLPKIMSTCRARGEIYLRSRVREKKLSVSSSPASLSFFFYQFFLFQTFPQHRTLNASLVIIRRPDASKLRMKLRKRRRRASVTGF